MDRDLEQRLDSLERRLSKHSVMSSSTLIPLGTAVVVVMVLMKGVTAFESVRKDVESIAIQITKVSAETSRNSGAIANMEREMVGGKVHDWNRFDMGRWCYRAERKNKAMEWQCDDPSDEIYD